MAGISRARSPLLLVLGAGPAQLGLLEHARGRGVQTIAVDRDPFAPGFTLATERAVFSIEDEPAVERLARARGVDGIVSPGNDWTVGVAARVAEKLGLSHPISPATAVLATSKQRQRERFAAEGVPHASALDPRRPTYPCVVKAPDRQGQRGLTLVVGPGELAAALETAALASRSGGILVEELVEGPEVTVNAFVSGGEFVPLTVTDRLLADPPAFGVALAHAWPSEHETDEAIEAAASAAHALGIEDGPVYVQLRLSDAGPKVMEVAARLGGGHDAELCEAALGVDLNALAIASALGQDVGDAVLTASGVHATRARAGGRAAYVGGGPVAASALRSRTRAEDGGACVAFLVAPEGELLGVDGVEEAEAVEGVEWVRVYRRPGWRFGPLRRGADRAGAILAVGSSREEALARARRAALAVRFRVDAGET